MAKISGISITGENTDTVIGEATTGDLVQTNNEE